MPDKPSKMKPAKTFRIMEFIQDELTERGWTLEDLATRMGGDDDVNLLTLELLDIQERGMFLGEETAKSLATVFGTSVELWLGMDRQARGVEK